MRVILYFFILSKYIQFNLKNELIIQILSFQVSMN